MPRERSSPTASIRITEGRRSNLLAPAQRGRPFGAGTVEEFGPIWLMSSVKRTPVETGLGLLRRHRFYGNPDLYNLNWPMQFLRQWSLLPKRRHPLGDAGSSPVEE